MYLCVLQVSFLVEIYGYSNSFEKDVLQVPSSITLCTSLSWVAGLAAVKRLKLAPEFFRFPFTLIFFSAPEA